MSLSRLAFRFSLRLSHRGITSLRDSSGAAALFTRSFLFLSRFQDGDVQENATRLVSLDTRSDIEKDSLEGDTCKVDLNVDKHSTTEETDVQEIDSRLALDDKARDPTKYISQENTNANDKDESAMIPIVSYIDVLGKGTILASDNALNLRDSYGCEGQDITEVRKIENSPNAGSVKEGGEKCEILLSSSLEGIEDYGQQTESCLRNKLLVTYHHHIDNQSKQGSMCDEMNW